MRQHWHWKEQHSNMDKKKIDIRHLTPKQIKQVHVWLRALIQLLFFLFMPSAFTAAFGGVKYIFTQIGAGEAIEMTSFVATLIALCAFTFIFGRFFCGFACAFGALGDAVRALYVWICKKLKKKPFTLSTRLASIFSIFKYVVLVLIVLMCFCGVYSYARGTSPWDVFSMLHAFNFKLGSYIVGVILLIIIIAGMCIQERFFCRFLCPMGAVFSMLPTLPFFTLCRDRDACIKGCSACTKKCPSDIGLPATGKFEPRGDCFMCKKCIDTCPKKNIHMGIRALRGNEIWLTILQAVLLLILYIFLGI